MADSSRHLDLPRGFHDYDPGTAAAYESLRRDWFNTCALAGFQQVEVPPVGFLDTFTHGHHAAGNRLYPFTDHRGRELALVSDSLPTLLRFARHRRLNAQRLSYCCPVFRYVRRPRRYFHHLGLMEVIAGSADIAVQYRAVERLAQIMATFLTRRLPVRFTVADPGLWRDLIDAPTASASTLLDAIRRCPVEQRPALVRSAGCTSTMLRFAEVLARDPALVSGDAADVLASSTQTVRDRVARAHGLVALIRQNGAESELNLGSLHASEFHDGPAFQIHPTRGRQLGDGGSYGTFTTAFLGTTTSAFSAIIGLERLADLAGQGMESAAADVAIIAHETAATIAHADALTALLRDRQIRVWDLIRTKRLDRHLRDLSAVGVPFVVVIGDEELTSDNYVVRDCAGAHHAVPQRDLDGWLAERLPG